MFKYEFFYALSNLVRASPKALTSGYIKKSLVYRKYLDIRAETGKCMHDISRHFGISLRPAFGVNQLGAKLLRLPDMHTGFDSICTRFVGTGDNAGSDFAIGQRDGLASLFGEIELFDRCEESIHIGKQNHSWPGLY